MVPVPLRLLAIGLAMLGGLAYPASADPPNRVARVSYISGPVSFRPASVDEWSAATLNYPLTVGDHVWTDRGGRVELELGSTFVRLAPSTEFSLLNLDDRASQLRLTQGTVTVRVRDLVDESVEIDTPNGALSILEPGFYRIDVDDSGSSTTVTARRGRADLTTGSAEFAIEAQESVVLEAGQSPYTLRAARGTDDFEDWALARDRRVETAAAVRYVSPQVIGYEDLDDYGVWQDAPGYGAVWVPRVRAEWAPYRYGHWAWIDPWGWTWIDDEPWGFAPFHYGRWGRVPAGWGWFPGYRVVRPVYAPALVAFVGGSGWHAFFSVGDEPVAWFPLGPRETFVPAYGVSFNYLRAVNAPHIEVRTNVTVANVTYLNRDVPGAVTAVPRDAFVHARPVKNATVAVPREVLRNAATVQAVPGRPLRDDSAHGARPGSAPPAAATSRSVIVRQAPPDAALAHFKNAPVTIASPAQASRPGRFAQPVQPRPPQLPDRVPLQERVAPRAGQPQERFVPPDRQRPERVAPLSRPLERFAPPPARERQERVAPQPEGQLQERFVPPDRQRPELVPLPSRPQERLAPEGPHQERAAPQERQREEGRAETRKRGK